MKIQIKLNSILLCCAKMLKIGYRHVLSSLDWTARNQIVTRKFLFYVDTKLYNC